MKHSLRKNIYYLLYLIKLTITNDDHDDDDDVIKERN